MSRGIPKIRICLYYRWWCHMRWLRVREIHAKRSGANRKKYAVCQLTLQLRKGSAVSSSRESRHGKVREQQVGLSASSAVNSETTPTPECTPLNILHQ